MSLIMLSSTAKNIYSLSLYYYTLIISSMHSNSCSIAALCPSQESPNYTVEPLQKSCPTITSIIIKESQDFHYIYN